MLPCAGQVQPGPIRVPLRLGAVVSAGTYPAESSGISVAGTAVSARGGERRQLLRGTASAALHGESFAAQQQGAGRVVGRCGAQ